LSARRASSARSRTFAKARVAAAEADSVGAAASAFAPTPVGTAGAFVPVDDGAEGLALEATARAGGDADPPQWAARSDNQRAVERRWLIDLIRPDPIPGVEPPAG
jgi:hypothetical protein